MGKYSIVGEWRQFASRMRREIFTGAWYYPTNAMQNGLDIFFERSILKTVLIGDGWLDSLFLLEKGFSELVHVILVS
jgi:hypothetical protein